VLVDWHYRELVDKYMIKIPPTKGPVPEPFLPSTLRDWEAGEQTSDIDWRATILARGPDWGKAVPLVREKLVEEAGLIAKKIPSLEIWVDTSGSMPDPRVQLNAFTVAALVLAAACIRQGGRVRGVIWSARNPIIMREWMRTEEAARRFFLQRIGGGTEFPIREFVELSRDRGPAWGAIRAIISDSDLNHNFSIYGGRAHDSETIDAFHDVAKRSERIVFVLNSRGGDIDAEAYQSLDQEKVKVVVVDQPVAPNEKALMQKLTDVMSKAMQQLGEALFEK